MGKSVLISENISKTQIVEEVFEAIKKAGENQKQQVLADNIERLEKEKETVSDTEDLNRTDPDAKEREGQKHLGRDARSEDDEGVEYIEEDIDEEEEEIMELVKKTKNIKKGSIIDKEI